MENKSLTANAVKRFRRIISLLLAILFVSSSFLTPINLVYADDNGELVIKSVTDPKAKNALIDGTKITITLPYGYEAETLELKDHPFYMGVQYHPEYKSTVATPHPLFKAWIKAAGKK